MKSLRMDTTMDIHVQTVTALPNEIWSQIFQYLDLSDTASLQLVNRHFNQIHQYICSAKKRFFINCYQKDVLLKRCIAKCMAQSSELELSLSPGQVLSINVNIQSRQFDKFSAQIKSQLKSFPKSFCNITQLIVANLTFDREAIELIRNLLPFLPNLKMLKTIFYHTANNGDSIYELFDPASRFGCMFCDCPQLEHLSIYSRLSTLSRVYYVEKELETSQELVANRIQSELPKLKEFYLAGLNNPFMRYMLSVLPPSVHRVGVFQMDETQLRAQLKFIKPLNITHLEIGLLNRQETMNENEMTQYVNEKFQSLKHFEIKPFKMP